MVLIKDPDHQEGADAEVPTPEELEALEDDAQEFILTVVKWKGYVSDSYFTEDWGLDAIEVREGVRELAREDEIELENENIDQVHSLVEEVDDFHFE